MKPRRGGQVAGVTGGQVVDDVDVVAGGDELVGDDRSDVSGTASDEKFHRVECLSGGAIGRLLWRRYSPSLGARQDWPGCVRNQSGIPPTTALEPRHDAGFRCRSRGRRTGLQRTGSMGRVHRSEGGKRSPGEPSMSGRGRGWVILAALSVVALMYSRPPGHGILRGWCLVHGSTGAASTTRRHRILAACSR